MLRCGRARALAGVRGYTARASLTLRFARLQMRSRSPRTLHRMAVIEKLERRQRLPRVHLRWTLVSHCQRTRVPVWELEAWALRPWTCVPRTALSVESVLFSHCTLVQVLYAPAPFDSAQCRDRTAALLTVRRGGAVGKPAIHVYIYRHAAPPPYYDKLAIADYLALATEQGMHRRWK
jgi:hypothetical protein